ncbi:alpha/beta hydrolase fold protein [Flavobacterium enshiense DK69]|nr:GNAT family N-acetyltransferase [Flavobacterium enshiense]ESU22750.1 alpha/beta hydrolase fold protein [Flavobacterium enshiense DK69]
MTLQLTIRPGTIYDLAELLQLFVDTITTVCTNDYNDQQIKVWTSGAEDEERWFDMLSNQFVLVAEDAEKIIGFCTLDKGNYVDLMYVHKDYQGQGIASRLYSEIEKEAIKIGNKRLTSDVSITARPFFEKVGFKVVTKQIVVRKGIELINFKMSKELTNMQTKIKFSPEEISINRIDNYPGRPTIIFLHDSLGCVELWRDFPEKLGTLTNCNVLVYDRQGYGKSCPFIYSKRDNDYMELEADILNELLSFWNIDKAILFGHSDGGSIALLTAAKYPEKISGIITEGAHVLVEEVTLNGIREAIDLYKTTDLKSKLEKYHGDNTEDMFWAWAGKWTSDEFRSWNIESFLPLIKCPSLIIQGEDDEYGTLEQVEKINSQVSGPSSKLIIPNIKHTPHKEAPDFVLDKSAEFISKLV